MAIVSSIAVGKASGSVGNVTFATVKGRVIMKEKTVSVQDKNSAAQQAQRSKMSSAVEAYQLIGNLSKSGFTRLTGYGSQYNAFVSQNIENIEVVYPVAVAATECTFAGLVISSGSLVNPAKQAIITAGKPQITVNLENLPEAQLKVGNKIVLVVYDSAKTLTVVKTVTLTSAHINAKTVIQAFDTLSIAAGKKIGFGAYMLTADNADSSSCSLSGLTA